MGEKKRNEVRLGFRGRENTELRKKGGEYEKTNSQNRAKAAKI